MTEEELDEIAREISREIEQLPDDPEKPLTRKEKKHRLVLRARRQALDRIKEAKEKGDFNREIRANMDYALLTEYGEKNVFLYNFMKARLTWRAF
jgi:hypothetical protein